MQGIAKKAQEHPKHRLGNLYELLNEPFLKEGWRDIRKEAASGVDRMGVQDDERNLDENSHHLVERGKRKRVFLKSPAREHRTSGSVRGRSGNRPSYRDDALKPNARDLL